LCRITSDVRSSRNFLFASHPVDRRVSVDRSIHAHVPPRRVVLSKQRRVLQRIDMPHDDLRMSQSGAVEAYADLCTIPCIIDESHYLPVERRRRRLFYTASTGVPVCLGPMSRITHISLGTNQPQIGVDASRGFDVLWI